MMHQHISFTLSVTPWEGIPVSRHKKELCQHHAVCVLEVARGARDATGEAAVLVLAGLFKTQAGTPPITPKALKVTSLQSCPVAPASALYHPDWTGERSVNALPGSCACSAPAGLQLQARAFMPPL